MMMQVFERVRHPLHRRRVAAVLESLQDADGGRRRLQKLVTGRTAGEVRERLLAGLGAVNQGLPAPDSRKTLREFVEWWRNEVLRHEGLAPATEQWYSDMLDHYVLPALGDRTLTGPRALTVGDVEALTAALSTRGLSTRV